MVTLNVLTASPKLRFKTLCCCYQHQLWSFTPALFSSKAWLIHSDTWMPWCYVKPTKMRREVSCLFCAAKVMTTLVTSYSGWRNLIAKLTAQPYFGIIAWLLIALSHTVQSVWNLLMFLKLVEMIHLAFFSSFFILNFLFDVRTVEAYQILYCMQYSKPPQCLC